MCICVSCSLYCIDNTKVANQSRWRINAGLNILPLLETTMRCGFRDFCFRIWDGVFSLFSWTLRIRRTLDTKSLLAGVVDGAKVPHGLNGVGTMTEIWRMLLWSLAVCLSGKWPAVDWDLLPWDATPGPTRKMYLKMSGKHLCDGSPLCSDAPWCWFRLSL